MIATITALFAVVAGQAVIPLALIVVPKFKFSPVTVAALRVADAF
jgi:hypothetical protein